MDGTVINRSGDNAESGYEMKVVRENGEWRVASLHGLKPGDGLFAQTHLQTTTIAAALDDTLVFDREWAFTLVARALAALEGEHADKAAQFSVLKAWLDGGAECSQAEAAQTLGMSETAVKVAILRLRVRFRELIRAEVAATVHDPAEVGPELRHLIAIASGG